MRGRLPAEMSEQIERGLETARARLREKELLVREAGAYLAAHPGT